MKTFLSFCLSFAIFTGIISAQNPLIRDQFSADPSARVFNDKVYVFPSHDILAVEGKGRVGWFCMEDYHVFSSSNLIDWTDHGIIVSHDRVKWADTTSYSMWAPDCIAKNGKYYFYFPVRPNDTLYSRSFSIGVAIADKPEGPYTPQPEPIKKVHGIDPNVFIDKDGQAYLYWALGNLFMAKLSDNMLELASEPEIIANMPEKGLKEGPYLFERNGIYYFTYPHVQNNTERLEYAIGKSPMGPFTYAGVIMDESPTGCWTNHQSFIEYNGQWYLFYHHNDYSPKFDKSRSVRADSMFFNVDGTIKKVIPSLRGIGITPASHEIQVDRYSQMSSNGVTVAFLDTSNTFLGWKTVLEGKGAWIQYNAVDFGKGKYKSTEARISSKTGGTLEIRLDNPNGALIAEIKVPAGTDWSILKVNTENIKTGVHNLAVVLKDDGKIKVDWLRFAEK